MFVFISDSARYLKRTPLRAGKALPRHVDRLKSAPTLWSWKTSSLTSSFFTVCLRIVLSSASTHSLLPFRRGDLCPFSRQIHANNDGVHASESFRQSAAAATTTALDDYDYCYQYPVHAAASAGAGSSVSTSTPRLSFHSEWRRSSHDDASEQQQ